MRCIILSPTCFLCHLFTSTSLLQTGVPYVSHCLGTQQGSEVLCHIGHTPKVMASLQGDKHMGFAVKWTQVLVLNLHQMLCDLR